MLLTRKQTHWYTHRLYKFLRDERHTIEFKKLREFRGYINYDVGDKNAHVVLDHRDKLIPTLIHEYLHYQHPEWTEEQVLKMEKLISNSLSKCQIRTIIKRFAEVL